MTMTGDVQAFLLLTLENITVRTPYQTRTGILGLECVTLSASAGRERDVFLVLKINDVEIPIEHSRHISLDTSGHVRKYTLLPTSTDPATIIIEVPTNWTPTYIEDMESFDSILGQYTDFSHDVGAPTTYNNEKSRPLSDYRGHLVLVNEDNGEVVGEFDRKINVHEDPTIHKQGHEKDPVVIEVPEGQSIEDEDEKPLEFFARAVPPDQQTFITKSATIVSHAITGGTSLFISVLHGASDIYIKRSAPSPHHPDSLKASADPTTGAPRPPPRALSVLTSDRTRQNLHTAHKYTGKAVEVSGKTIAIVHGMIKKGMGSEKDKDKGKRAATAPSGGLSPSISKSGSRAPSPTPSLSRLSPAPPAYNSNAYTSSPTSQYSTTQFLAPSDSKPPLPPRGSSGSRTPSPAPSASSQQSASASGPPLPPRKVGFTKRLLLSADLILSTMDDSAKRILLSGQENVGNVMRHKYGEQAGASSDMAMGTARNVALVYVDVKGLGRRAILRTAGKEFVKGRLR